MPPMWRGAFLGRIFRAVRGGRADGGDTAKLLRLRGEAMQSAVPVGGVGAMAAVLGLDLATVREVAEEAARDSGGARFVRRRMTMTPRRW